MPAAAGLRGAMVVVAVYGRQSKAMLRQVVGQGKNEIATLRVHASVRYDCAAREGSGGLIR